MEQSWNYGWNLSTCICENSKYLKSIADISVTVCNEIISVMDNVSTKKTSSIATNVIKNCRGKSVRYRIDCYILHTVLLAIILILIITIIYFHYAKHSSKQKGFNALTI